ncbi:glycosyltransferase family 2 protein [bacterium]|nr:glycosyltransferase family 2 protein [bacterium]
MKDRPEISVVILVHRNTPLLERVFESIAWAPEIIVVVSEHLPEVEALAARFSAKVFQRTLDGFGAQKQFGIDHTTHEWVFIVDSDEIVSPECRDHLFTVLNQSSSAEFAAYRVNQQLVFQGKVMRYGGTLGKPIRLFHKSRAHMNLNPVHEKIETTGKVGHLEGALLHFSYQNWEDYFDKVNRYTSLGARELLSRGKSANPVFLWFRFPVLFLRRYIFQLGFLDGYNGFVWAMFSAWYPIIKYLKLRELER